MHSVCAIQQKSQRNVATCSLASAQVPVLHCDGISHLVGQGQGHEVLDRHLHLLVEE